MSQKTLSKTALNKIKKAAKDIKTKYPGVLHTQALEIVAKQEGFDSYREVQKAYKLSGSSTSSATPKNKILAHILTLMDEICTDPEFGEQVLQHLDVGIREIQDLHKDILNNGINIRTKTFGNLFFILGFSFDKETLKEIGYKLLREDGENKKLTGLLYIALAHFYRSAQNVTTYENMNHPNFETYIADWLRSVPPHDNEMNPHSYLSRIFQENIDPRMKNGSTHWPE